MSATLTWNVGQGTKTGTTVAALFSDMNDMVVANVANANFSWQVASVNFATTPYYLVLKRKSGASGRMLLVMWSSAPAANNAAILDQAPTTNNLFGAWFPNGNVDTPSNLTAASGTILGNDTGAIKCWAALALTSIYTTSLRAYYGDSAEALVFGFQNPATGTMFFGGGGDILVDNSDNAYGAVFSYGSGSAGGLGGSTVMDWVGTTPLAGASSVCIRTNYGSANRVYFHAWRPTGSWANQAVSGTDILTDTGTSRAWFVPVQLIGQTKGEGAVLKYRQIGFGPATSGPFAIYSTTGPVTAAIQWCALTAGGTGYPWLTNFKL